MKSKLQTLLIFFLIGSYSILVKADVTVIANKSVKETTISSKNLNRIYAMQIKTWSDGSAIKVFTFHTHSDVYKDFVLNRARLQPHQLERHWKRLLFTGMGRTPVEVANNDDMIELVKSTPGAIGYVSEPSHLEEVKVLKVEEQ